MNKIILFLLLFSGCTSSVSNMCPFNQNGNCSICNITINPKPKPPSCYCVETKIDCEECKKIN